MFSCVPPAVTSTVVPSSSLDLHICDSSHSTMSLGSGRRPTPVIPQASQPSAGSIIWYPKVCNPSKFRCVMGLLYISVFIAGQRYFGAVVAIIVVVSISSAIPA